MNPLKHLHPQRLLRDTATLLAFSKKAKQPVWLKALRMFPTSLPLRSIIPAETGAFAPPDSTVLQHKNSLNTSRNHGRIDWRRAVIRQPLPITYDEDTIRKTFYAHHPYELDRPQRLSDSSVVWTSISAGAQLTGESVVQRTLYLESARGGGMRRADAYEKALDEFYRMRQSQEEAEIRRRCDIVARARKTDPDAVDPYAGKPVSKEFARKEQIEFEKAIQLQAQQRM